MTHTQGPWTINGIDTVLSASANRTVAKVYRPEDDARLIAAAPELLEAAEWVIRNAGYEKGEASPSLKELCVSRYRLDNLRAAIAKAKEA